MFSELVWKNRQTTNTIAYFWEIFCKHNSRGPASINVSFLMTTGPVRTEDLCPFSGAGMFTELEVSIEKKR